MSRSQREAQLKALAGEQWGLNIITELGGPKRDRREALEREIEGSYAKGTMGFKGYGAISKSPGFGFNTAQSYAPAKAQSYAPPRQAPRAPARVPQRVHPQAAPTAPAQGGGLWSPVLEARHLGFQSQNFQGQSASGTDGSDTSGNANLISGEGLWSPGQLDAQRNFQRQSGGTGPGAGQYGGHFGANFDRPSSETGASVFSGIQGGGGQMAPAPTPAPLPSKYDNYHAFQPTGGSGGGAQPAPQGNFDPINFAPMGQPQDPARTALAAAPQAPQQGAYMPDLSWMDNPNLKSMGAPMRSGAPWIRSVEQQYADAGAGASTGSDSNFNRQAFREALKSAPSPFSMFGFQKGTLGEYQDGSLVKGKFGKPQRMTNVSKLMEHIPGEEVARLRAGDMDGFQDALIALHRKIDTPEARDISWDAMRRAKTAYDKLPQDMRGEHLINSMIDTVFRLEKAGASVPKTPAPVVKGKFSPKGFFGVDALLEPLFGAIQNHPEGADLLRSMGINIPQKGYQKGSLADIIEGALTAPDVGPQTPDLRKYGPVAASNFPLTAGSLLAAKMRGLDVEETPEGAYKIQRDKASPDNWGQTLGDAIWMNPGMTPEQDDYVYEHELGHVSQGRDSGLMFPILNAADQLKALMSGTNPQDSGFEGSANRRGRAAMR